MSRRVITVAELARSAGIDNEEVLISLWEVGLDHYVDSRDRIPRREMDEALKAVGLPTTRDVTDPIYWMDRLKLDDKAFRDLLVELGVQMTSGARILPKGAAAKLRRLGRAELASPQPEPEHLQHEPKTDEDFEWRVVGHLMDPRLLSEAEVESVYWELVRDFANDADPIRPAGIRSSDLLASAVFRQHTAMGEETKYPTVEMAAAALFHALVHNHPFYNGNKRAALVSLLVLLDENGVIPTCEEGALFELVLRLTQHRLVPRGGNLVDREMIHLAEWIQNNSRSVEKGERPIQWRKLRHILAGFGCAIRQPTKGNRLNIRRTIEEKRILGRPRRRELSTQVKYADDGREALVSTVKKIRRDLWLDEDHGVDSSTFYERGGLVPSGFIIKYRKTLKQLARL